MDNPIFFNQGVNILVACSVSIDAHTWIGDFAAVRDTKSHSVSPRDAVHVAPVVIGQNVWIGRSAIVIQGLAADAVRLISRVAAVTTFAVRCVQ